MIENDYAPSFFVVGFVYIHFPHTYLFHRTSHHYRATFHRNYFRHLKPGSAYKRFLFVNRPFAATTHDENFYVEQFCHGKIRSRFYDVLDDPQPGVGTHDFCDVS